MFGFDLDEVIGICLEEAIFSDSSLALWQFGLPFVISYESRLVIMNLRKLAKLVPNNDFSNLGKTYLLMN